MTYQDFERAVVGAGLRPRKCSGHHWQILGGPGAEVVNCWPNSKAGFRYQVGDAKSRIGTLLDAIKAADPHRYCPPWEEPIQGASPQPQVVARSDRVGLIRWLWRLLW
jgi:hypothetical protein